MRLIIIFLFACSCTFRSGALPSSGPDNVKLGIDVFLAFHADSYKKLRICLVTNHSGFDSAMNRNIASLREKGIIISDVLAPEHGISGIDEDYSSKKSYFNDQMNVTIHNMHNYTADELRKFLSAYDTVIFDIQDLGMRCYTYISNLRELIEALNGSNTELVVLDRPNPLAPFGMSGFDLDPKFKSRHVSSFPAPLFYSLTIGEAALYYKGEKNLSVRINVIKMKNYRKDMFFDSMNLQWIPPSPNLPAYRSALNYSALIYLESTNLSVGRGTTKPFEFIGAPWINPELLSESLNKLKLNSFIFRPVYFEPKYLVNTGTVCGGVHAIYTGGYFDPNEISYNVIQTLFRLYPEKIAWRGSNGRFEIDYIAGSSAFRQHIESGKSYEELRKLMKKSRKNYSEKIKKYLLY